MKKQTIRSQDGAVVIMVAFIILLAVMIIGISQVMRTGLNSTVAENYKKKIQSFYASDGLMTGLAQEVIDGRGQQLCGQLIEPIVLLDFDEGSGTSARNSGTSSPLYPVGTLFSTDIAWSAQAPYDRPGFCLDFGTTFQTRKAVDIPTSSVSFNELNGLKSFTITGWLNNRSTTVGSGGNRIVSWCTGGGGLDLVYLSDGSMQIGINQWPDGSPARSNSGKITTSTSAPQSNWKFFAVTYTGLQVTFYFGTPFADAAIDRTVGYNRGALNATGMRLAIGGFNSLFNGSDRVFRGKIDQIRIYGSYSDASGALGVADIIKIQKNASLQDTIKIGPFNVFYNISKSSSTEDYTIHTESFLTLKNNRSFITPLHQHISPQLAGISSAIGGENVTKWKNIRTGNRLLENDSLWLGAVFLRDTTKDLEVELHGKETVVNGKLYFIDKDGTDYYLFDNDMTSGERRNISALFNPEVRHGDTIYFRYDYRFWDGNDYQKFTGPNRRVGDPESFSSFDRYTSNTYVATNLPGQTFANYRRWCVAEWLRLPDGTVSDVVEFGFEDQHPGDADFDDIVFRVKGVRLNTMDPVPPKSNWRRDYGNLD